MLGTAVQQTCGLGCSQRVIEANLKDAAASVHYEGLGYEGKSGDLMLDENGLRTWVRIITLRRAVLTPEWVDSSGTLHTEMLQF